MVWIVVASLLVVLLVLVYPAWAIYQWIFCSRQPTRTIDTYKKEKLGDRVRALVALRGGGSLEEGVCLKEANVSPLYGDKPIRYAIPCCVCGGGVDMKNLLLVRRIDQYNVHEACIPRFLFSFLLERYRLARRVFVRELGEVLPLIFDLLYHHCLFSPSVKINTGVEAIVSITEE